MDQYAKVVAMDTTPDFIRLIGNGTTYKPQKGDTGYMKLADAKTAQTAGSVMIKVDNLQYAIEQALVAPPAPTVVKATGVTAGAPGAFTPTGATLPATLAALNALKIGTGAAWSKDDYIVLGDSSKAHWDGAAFAAGVAP